MPKIPSSAKKEIPRKCPLCQMKFKNKEALVSHIDRKHHSQIPKGWSPSRYENYLRTGKTNGTCVICNKNTEWNESTWKYNRDCGSPKCKQEMANRAKKNMISVYGKPHLLNDADMQRKMIYAKHTSGEYEWSTDTSHKYQFMYASQQEKNFLEMLDLFLHFYPNDVFSPSPNTYVYKYKGEDHQYIPDVFIASLNLEVEIKEPKDNQNMHPKIQAVDKVKEDLKDKMMGTIPNINYIKVNGTDYSEFFALLSYLKNSPDNREKLEHDFLSSVGESTGFDVLQELCCIDVTEASTHKEINKMLTGISILVDVAKPKYTYTRTLNTIKRSVKRCETKEELEELKIFVNSLSHQLELQVKMEDGNSRMRAEAERAIHVINKEIMPELNSKMKVVKESIDDDISFPENRITNVPDYDDSEYVHHPVFTKYMNEMDDHMDYTKKDFTYEKIAQELEEMCKKCSTVDDCMEMLNLLDMVREKLVNHVHKYGNTKRNTMSAEELMNIIDVQFIPKMENRRHHLNESVNITATKDDTRYKPVFVFLSYTGTPFSKAIRAVTKEDYSHASLSLDTKLDHMMSFGTRPTDKKLGFIPVESIHDKAFTDRNYSTFALYMYLAPMEEYFVMDSLIKSFKSNVNTFRYNTIGCLKLLFGLESHNEESYFCSEFVSKILYTANPKLIKKDPSLMTPGDLGKTRKMIKIASGNIKDYDEAKVDKTVQKILRKKGFTDVEVTY